MLPLIAAALLQGGAPVERIALGVARLLDVEQGRMLEDALVLVEGTSIVAVGARTALALPDGARRIELGDVTLLPGLVDAHVHLAWGPAVTPARSAASPPASGPT